jgi:cell fate (sporulation/competence/biofilm development) regulator YlbF (YheA/YmcA/DUF963 family)
MPHTLSEILDLATRLGRALADQPRFQAVRDAETAVIEDAKSRGLAEDLERLRESIERRRDAGEPDAAIQSEFDVLRRVEESVRADSKLQQLARAQADFAQMMNEVHARIYGELGPADAES